MATKKIEVLVLDGCPNADKATQRARSAIERAGVYAELLVEPVENDDDAMRRRFLGSPTVRVDGVDVEEAAMGRDDFGLQCRVYAVDGRIEGAPPVEWISAALRRHR